MNINDVLTDPKKLVALELKNAGYDIEDMKVPKRVYLLADIGQLMPDTEKPGDKL